MASSQRQSEIANADRPDYGILVLDTTGELLRTQLRRHLDLRFHVASEAGPRASIYRCLTTVPSLRKKTASPITNTAREMPVK